jgi:DnaJ-class molecular chaperone
MNYYDILKVNISSSQSEIKSAYRKLSMKYHPDKGGDAEKFKQINEAYQTLGDVEKKNIYDMKNNNPFMDNNTGDMNNIFKMFFNKNDPFSNHFFQTNGNTNSNIRIFHNGRPVNINAINKPTPIIKTINITLEDAYNGKNIPMIIERWIMNENIKKTEKENIYISIPKGIDNNEIIILKGKGNVINEYNKGDVKLFIKIANNTIFDRRGLDLYYKKKISLKESLIGFDFDLNYFNNKIFTINNNDFIIKPGYKKIINNLGMERKNVKGNLIITFEITFPEKLSKSQIKSLKNIL